MFQMQRLFPTVDAVDGGVMPEGDEVPVENDEYAEGPMECLCCPELQKVLSGDAWDAQEISFSTAMMT
jgi:hypothetical protein